MMFSANDFDMDKLVEDAQQRVAKMAAIRERTAALTGHAESADARIRVTSSADDPVAELHIDPRAMRMSAEDLSEAVRSTVKAARRDLDRQVEELTAFEYGDSVNPLELMKNKDALKETLSEVQGMFEKAGRETQGMIEQLQRNLGIPGQAPPR
ncbi:YbaB/EbfC family nucleoid-associated protein [Actinomadura geliboluensis]|uniref:YbaB/EbfC family nucleoid-associated protein n=1 Tax=Actinomadura geliboluensis TaxID=882440 RepID=UPI0026306C16|nr:YbaB/EbfC family nucleoid-associated protein [Actinomadura geliboluensis]